MRISECFIQRSGLDRESVTVNGMEQKFTGRPLFDSRLIKADWLNQSFEAGLLTIGDEKMGKLILDFRGKTNLARELILPQ